MIFIRYSGTRRRAAGFTLIEALVTIVITGIIAGMVATFLVGPIQGFLGTASRGELSDAADLTLRRLSREVRQALPNSLRVTSGGTGTGAPTYIEFIATTGGGQYRDPLDTSGNQLNFSDATVCTALNHLCKFDVIGAMPANPGISDGSVVGVPADYIVVYNLGQDASGHSYAPADAYVNPCDPATPPCVGTNRAKVAAVDSAGKVVTLDPVPGLLSNVFATQVPPLPSATQRFHVVPGGVKAVTFSCITSDADPTLPTAHTGFVNRYAGYGFFSTAALSIAALNTPSKLATNASCSATYTAAASQRNGLLTVKMTLKNSDKSESVTLEREIHLDNSP